MMRIIDLLAPQSIPSNCRQEMMVSMKIFSSGQLFCFDFALVLKPNFIYFQLDLWILFDSRIQTNSVWNSFQILTKLNQRFMLRDFCIVLLPLNGAHQISWPFSATISAEKVWVLISKANIMLSYSCHLYWYLFANQVAVEMNPLLVSHHCKSFLLLSSEAGFAAVVGLSVVPVHLSLLWLFISIFLFRQNPCCCKLCLNAFIF